MDLFSELRSLVEAFAAQGIEYAVCGGVALALHGHPRFTKDIDLLVLPEQRAQVITVAQEHGFLGEAGLIPFKECDVYRISKIEGSDILTLDLLIVNQNLEEAWAGRQAYQWQGRLLQVVSAQGLIQMKKMAGRAQDLVDIANLEKTHGPPTSADPTTDDDSS